MISIFSEFSEVTAGMSEKSDGSMRVASSNPEVTFENRKQFFEKQGIDPTNIFAAILVHGKKVKRIIPEDARIIPDTDALVTSEKGVFLSVTGADCFPIYFYDSKKRIIGLAHAGWRGAVANIVKEVLGEMAKLGSDTRDIHVAFGPGICPRHYEFDLENVAPDRKELFSKWLFALKKHSGKVQVDLQSIMKSQLLEAGIPERNIRLSEYCTSCEPDKFFSYRRDRPEEVEAMVAFIGVK